MTNIQVVETAVPVSDSLDLVGDAQETTIEAYVSPDLVLDLRIAAFETLFPECYDPQKVLPVPDMDVFILDSETARQTKLVHVAAYVADTKSFESDGGWFESLEVLRWAYVPDVHNESLRTLVP